MCLCLSLASTNILSTKVKFKNIRKFEENDMEDSKDI